MSVVISSDDGRTKITISILRYEQITFNDPTDGEWLVGDVSIRARGHSAAFALNPCVGELQRFASDLRTMHERLEGSLAFVMMEPYLDMEATIDKMGVIHWELLTRDSELFRDRLRLQFSNNQSHLPAMIRSLESVLAEFPIRPMPQRKP